MLDFIQNSSSPIIVAAFVGIILAIDPCTLFSNIAAIGYISKDYGNKKQIFRSYVFFVFGRIITLGFLGLILVFLFQKSIYLLHIRDFLTKYGELILIPFLIITGLMLLFPDKISFLEIHFSTQNIEKRNKNSSLKAFLLGSVLSLIFCPTNIVLFFGILLPLAVEAKAGGMLPFVCSVSSAIPIVAVMLIMFFSISNIEKFYKIADKIGKYIVKISGILFILTGIYILAEHLF